MWRPKYLERTGIWLCCFRALLLGHSSKRPIAPPPQKNLTDRWLVIRITPGPDGSVAILVMDTPMAPGAVVLLLGPSPFSLVTAVASGRVGEWNRLRFQAVNRYFQAKAVGFGDAGRHRRTLVRGGFLE